MDLIQATNTPEPLELAGSSYPCRPLLLKEWAAFQSWLVSRHSGPLARAATALQQLRDAGTPADLVTEELLLDHAQRESLHWPPRVGSRGWLEAIDSLPDGLAKLVHTVLVAADAKFTAAAAAVLADAMSIRDAERLIDLSVYGIRTPKADAAAAAEAPAAT